MQTGKTYSKRLGLFRDPAVRRELAQLNPVRDTQRMVQLLVAYEFSYDITRSLELALFHTYASPRVSGLLARTGEFERHGQKRYDDTSRLIAQFMESGYDGELGRRAIDHMNLIHSHYRIDNIDYLFVLATFVTYPINWLRQYGWRKLTAKEEEAIFRFFMEVGCRMNLHDVPETMAVMLAFSADYEQRYFRYTESNRRVADATVRIVENWFPALLRFVVKPAVSALISPPLRNAFGYAPAPGWFVNTLEGALWLRKWPLRWLTFEPYPSMVATTTFRHYPNGAPEIETVGPDSTTKELG